MILVLLLGIVQNLLFIAIMFDPQIESCLGDLLKILEKLKEYALKNNVVVVISTGYAKNSRFEPAEGKILSNFVDVIVHVLEYRNRIEFCKLKWGPFQYLINLKIGFVKEIREKLKDYFRYLLLNISKVRFHTCHFY